MISVVCVMNDEQVFRYNLKKTLENQDIKSELILVDNRNNEFPTLTAALNFGGKKASGDYIMFVHQDVCLIGGSWFTQVEKVLSKLDDLGVAGVSGMTETGVCKGFVNDRGELWGSPLKEPINVQTLDEVMLIISKNVFDKLKFDEQFRYHSYGADYSLSVKALNLNAYVIPALIKHNSLTVGSIQAGSLLEDDIRLLKKHGKKSDQINKTTGSISFRAPKIGSLIITSKKISTKISTILKITPRSKSDPLDEILPDKDKIVLDLGLVPREQLRLKSVRHKNYSIGVSDDKSQIIISKKLVVHDDFVLAQLDYMPFKNKSFDIGLLIGLLEYRPISEGLKYIRVAENICKEVILIVPNNCSFRNNSFRTFLSCWTSKTLKKSKYHVYGLDFAKTKQLDTIAEILSSYILTNKIYKFSLFSSKLLAIKDVSENLF